MEFYLLTDEEKKEMSTYLVNNGWDILTIESGISKYMCPFCTKLNSCVGHYGLLDLEDYYINPLFTKKIREEIKKPKMDIFKDPVETRKLLPEKFKCLVMRFIIIPPPSIRTTDDIEWQNSITKLYTKLIECVKKQNKNGIRKYLDLLFSSTKKTSLVKILGGKEGIFRKICFGKRINGSARSVIVGDTSIDLDQVLIPKDIANNLFVKCTIEKNGGPYFLTPELELKPEQCYPGIQALRKLQDNDLVLLNRQPTLSQGSILSFRSKIREDNTKVIGIHPNVTKTFNADFDGDEMNIFVFPHSEDLEKCNIINFPNFISNIQDSKVSEHIFGIKEKTTTQKDYYLDLYNKLDERGLTISLEDLINKKFQDTCLKEIIDSGSKGSIKNFEQMTKSLGDQFLHGKKIGSCKSSFVEGLNEEEFFIHQMSSRGGVVSTGVITPTTGYLNRKCARVLGDVLLDEKGVIYDNYGIIGNFF